MMERKIDKTDNQKKALATLKQKHFEVLRKNNAVTDAKNGDLSLQALKLQEIILYKYQENPLRKMQIEVKEIRRKLGLQKNNDYVNRIQLYFMELKLPILLRNFHTKTGEQASWSITSFLGDVTAYKEREQYIEIEISEKFLECMVDSAGYTKIILEHSSQFTSKFGFKLAETYFRYKNMPNRIDNSMGMVQFTVDEMNEKFGTNHKYASKLFPGLNTGIKEVLKIFGVELFYHYEKKDKVFILGWEKEKTDILKKRKQSTIVPSKRIEELADWIIYHTKGEIKDHAAYKAKLIKMIKANSLDEMEKSYRGMLRYRYKFTADEINDMMDSEGNYKDFKNPPAAKDIFNL